jgi:membrane-associated phospholipid phosphatase
VSRRSIAIYALFIALFGVFCYFANRYDYFPGDVTISQWLQGIDNAWFKPLMQYAPYVVGLGLVILLLFRLWWRAPASIALTAGAAGLISWLLKLIVSRPRPPAELVQIMVDTHGLGFPSGHVAWSTVIGALLFYLAPRLVKQKATVWFLRALLIVLILVVGFSRIYLGAHWLSDVVGGLFLGALLLYPAIFLYNKYGVNNA